MIKEQRQLPIPKELSKKLKDLCSKRNNLKFFQYKRKAKLNEEIKEVRLKLQENINGKI